MNEVTPKAGPKRAARTPALLHGYPRESAMKGAALYDEMPDSVAKTVFSQSLKDLAEEGLVSREHFALRLGTVLNPKSFLRRQEPIRPYGLGIMAVVDLTAKRAKTQKPYVYWIPSDE